MALDFVYYGKDILVTNEQHRVIGVVKMFGEDTLPHQTPIKAPYSQFQRKNDEILIQEGWRAAEAQRKIREYEGR